MNASATECGNEGLREGNQEQGSKRASGQGTSNSQEPWLIGRLSLRRSKQVSCGKSAPIFEQAIKVFTHMSYLEGHRKREIKESLRAIIQIKVDKI
jgi:hypothetical protein